MSSVAAVRAGPLDRLLLLWRDLGRLDGTLYLLDRLLGGISSGRMRVLRYAIVAQPVGRASATALRPDARTCIERLPAGHELAASFPRPPAVIAQRYRDGADCIGATVGGDFAGFIWWQRGRYEEDEVRCSYVLDDPARCVWDFDVYVEPRFRLGRTLARLWAAVDGELAADGVAWSFSRISTFNQASLAAHARMGTVERCRVLFVRIGRLQLSLLPGSPRLHVSISDRRRPTLRLAAP